MALDLYISKIKMKKGFMDSRKLTDIQELYCDGVMARPAGWYPVEVYWHHLLETPWKPVYVNIYPYPRMIPRKTKDGVHYVTSTIERDVVSDVLLFLPREEAEV